MKQKHAMRLRLTALVAALGLSTALGAQTDSSQTLLWKISGNGIQPSYLFGTIHLLPQADFDMDAKTVQAFEDTEQLVMELDMDDPGMQAEMLQGMNMRGDTTLKDLLTADEYAKVEALVFESVKMPLSMMDRYKPMVVASMLIPDYIEGTPASFEATFTQMAVAAQKEILGLETVTEQLAVFDSIPYAVQAQELLHYTEDDPEMRALFGKLVEAYKAEDMEAIDDYMEQEIDDPAEVEFMLHNRNRNWVPRMRKLASGKSTFFAVGAGHLGGDAGMIQLLRDAGYTVTPILD